MNEHIVNMERVTVDRGARKNVLNIEEFALKPGELVAVVGPNGAGKSTLLQVINLLQSYSGEMQLFGQNASHRDATVLRRRSAMVLQDMLLLNDTVFNNVALALRFRGVKESEVKEQVYKALADFRCDHLATRQALSLSGGESQRVCIARAMVTAPELLLLDEPFAALDAATRDELIEEIRKKTEQRGITVLLVSHNFADVLHFAQRTLVIFNGRIVQDDKPENIMRRPLNEQVARLVGMDNIIPCHMEQESQDRFIKLSNGIRFLYHGESNDSISACCIPGDALCLYDETLVDQSEPWVVMEGLVERVIPGIGAYRILVKIGEQIVSARVPREHITSNIDSNSPIKLAFRPAEVHFV
ncbi:MAG: ABC transporter ATP-binding protein [Sporomusaceae bacterium]|nr:ABC transporter ATP-binding protein [Sporomusaceae bacterium]